MLLSEWSGRRGGSLRFWGPGLLSTSPAFSMSSASHSAGSSGWLAPKTGAGPTFQLAGKVDAICRSRSNRAKRPRAGCILRSSTMTSSFLSSGCTFFVKDDLKKWLEIFCCNPRVYLETFCIYPMLTKYLSAFVGSDGCLHLNPLCWCDFNAQVYVRASYIRFCVTCK